MYGGCVLLFVVVSLGAVLPFLFALIGTISARSELEGVDPNTLSCDPRGQVFLLLPHYSVCSKFYMCAHGEEVEFSCAPGDLVFNFVDQTCDWTKNTNCTLRKRSDEDDIEDGSGEDWLLDGAYKTYDGSVKSITADSVVNSVRPLSIESPGKSPNYDTNLNCLRADSASRQVPYKGDCQRYWRCMNGVPEAMYCSDGLLFNERTQQCDFEANVKCMVELEDELKTEFILFKN